MNLIIDIGNTKIKAALFQKGELIHDYVSEKEELIFVTELLSQFNKIESAIVSSVKSSRTGLMKLLTLRLKNAFYLDANLPIPLENLYETKNTLGYDRLAACVGAYERFPGSNILVIDAGTAITFDFINAKAQYIGGCISPGLNMRYKALNHFTKKLPILSIKEDYPLIGKNTTQAITGGVQNGIVFEVDSYINQLRKEHRNLTIVLTGGDAHFLYNNIENKVFLLTDILLFGLNRILEFNLLKQVNN